MSSRGCARISRRWPTISNNERNQPTNQEIEVRFPDIDKIVLWERLKEVGATDLGETMLEEIIFYPHHDGQSTSNRFARIRKDRSEIKLAYKHHFEHSATGTTEIELIIDDMTKAADLLAAIGWKRVREQQKKRHDFLLNGCQVSIDEWPRAAPYVEIEGASEDKLKETAVLLGLAWENVYLKNAMTLLQERRNLPVGRMRTFTFDQIEYVDEVKSSSSSQSL